MSRYVLWTEDENLEVFVGFDEGFEQFFLTIADARTSTGEADSYLFHNMDHHPDVGMTLGEVASTLQRFGIALPADLAMQLADDAQHFGSPDAVTATSQTPIGRVGYEFPQLRGSWRVLRWQAV
jgi:hypothetical protein